MTDAGRIYFGHVMHARLRPFRHAFRYRVFSLLLDLDRLDELARLRVFSRNRFNLFSFHDRDHGPRDGRALRPWIEANLATVGIVERPNRILLLSFPRLLGYVFNPLSVYYCYDDNDRLMAVNYEVKNTFGGQHSYVIAIAPDDTRGTRRHDARKVFYVSPFIAMDCTYHFRLSEPTDRLAIAIRQADKDGDLLIATQDGVAADLSDRNLLAAFLRYPLLTFKVLGAIHWQALRLWLKGAKLQPRGGVVSSAVSRGHAYALPEGSRIDQFEP